MAGPRPGDPWRPLTERQLRIWYVTSWSLAIVTSILLGVLLQRADIITPGSPWGWVQMLAQAIVTERWIWAPLMWLYLRRWF